MNTMTSPYPSYTSKRDALLNKDRWNIEELGLLPDNTHSAYYLEFSMIEQDWLKLAAKRFVRFQSATRSMSSCRSYISAISRFSFYLSSVENKIMPGEVSRMLMIGFFEYLKKKGYGVVTRRTTIVHIRTFHQIILQEDWLPWPIKPLIYSTDIPKGIISYPRYIPEVVIVQLKKSLYDLEPYLQRLVTILHETGRRISEVCSLVFDCLEQDDQKDWYLRVSEIKFKKIRLIPVSNQCVKAIKEQQKSLEAKQGKQKYLFPARKQSKSLYISARHFNTAINKLAQKHEIKDLNGKIWRFSAHQFRHTLATSMINNGVPQVMVQNYLGHTSPEMTARYAHIHNETLKKAFKGYQNKLINIHGKIKPSGNVLDGQWLKKNIMRQALPNGLCSLPLIQSACPHANACLSCTHFCTSKDFLPQHRDHLKQTKNVIENAKKNGWQRILEMNTTVEENLKLIISNLEGEKND